MRRVDKGQLYFSVVAVVALGWEKEEDCEAKLFLRNDLGFYSDSYKETQGG